MFCSFALLLRNKQKKTIQSEGGKALTLSTFLYLSRSEKNQRKKQREEDLTLSNPKFKKYS